jgi:hypothetical protein
MGTPVSWRHSHFLPSQTGSVSTAPMIFSKHVQSRLGRPRPLQVWVAGLVLRHRWCRVLLHLAAMARAPRHIPWHWHLILHEFHDSDRRQ